MPRKKQTVEERKYTATEVGELIVAAIKASSSKHEPPAEPEPTEDGGE